MTREAPSTPLRPKQRPTRQPTLGNVYTMREVARHDKRDDGWIVVGDVVYDITNFANYHPGWTEGGMTSTVLAIQRTLGTDCTREFYELHTPGQIRTLQSFAIGRVAREEIAPAWPPAAAPMHITGHKRPADHGLVDALPEVLVHRVCCLLDAAALCAAAAVERGGLGRHARAYGAPSDRGRRTFVSLPCRPCVPFDAIDNFSKGDPMGMRIEDGVVEATPRWMKWNRVLDMNVPLAPQCLFEVEILRMKALTLDVGLAAFVDGQTVEWYVDGSGRAVHKARNEDSDRVAFAYGPRFGAGRRVGVFRRAGLVSFCVDGRDLGAAFERVPSNARPFVRFPTGGAAGEGDAVRLAEAGALCHVDAGAPPPGPLDGRLVVQQFGPELDDWLSLRVAPTATARTLRRIVATVLTSRGERSGGAAASPVDLDLHLLPTIADAAAELAPTEATASRAASRGLIAACAEARYGSIKDKDLDRPLKDFGVRFLSNGIQSRPVFVNLVRDIS
mmetsp:Transcript_29344/g.88276  ORF Transcript_29344/g.88276 Transcript_29344/m.88276 type:complete len:503 (-) Transcript_29344:40-1548(-)